MFDVTPTADGYNPVPNGVLDPGLDLALFSVSTFSPSTFTQSGGSYTPGLPGFLSPADVLFTDFTGEFSLFAPAAELGLASDDELNALDTAIPEPLSLVVWSFLAIGLLGWRELRA